MSRIKSAAVMAVLAGVTSGLVSVPSTASAADSSSNPITRFDRSVSATAEQGASPSASELAYAMFERLPEGCLQVETPTWDYTRVDATEFSTATIHALCPVTNERFQRFTASESGHDGQALRTARAEAEEAGCQVLKWFQNEDTAVDRNGDEHWWERARVYALCS
jgi:hypothetical protein